jgi:serine/threonine protein kinase
MAITVGTRVGAYEITGLLGKGGMGEVYRSRDTKLKRDVAIKVLPVEFSRDPERIQRFRREAEVLATLNHPHIGQIYGLEETASELCLVLELAEGETLDERLRRGAIPVTEALRVAIQIALALEAAHERGIVHRDLKPANIKISSEGNIKVLDFGLAKAMDATHAEPSASQSPTMLSGSMPGVILGTAAYMSPEQAKGRQADARSDVWAFGCVLYEMLTGRRTFTGETTVEILGEVLKTEPDWTALPAATPRAVQSLLKRCMQKDRTRRQHSIADARIQIEEALSDPVETQQTSAVPVSRSWGLIAALLVLAFGLGVSATYILRPGRPNTGPVTPARFTVSPSEGTRLFSADYGPFGSMVVISPDGRRLAFVAAGPDAQRRLWIRSLDATTAQPLAGTEGASGPFWSFDSEALAFFADGKLKRVSASGGDVRVICEAGPGGGGSWNQGNVILFNPADAGEGGLFRVPASGGAPVPVTTLDAAAGETNHLWPQFLPDGRQYLFFVSMRQRETSGIYVGSLDAPSRLLLLPEPQLDGQYSMSKYALGYLLFFRGRTLMAQSFDPASLKLSGDAFRVADNIATWGPGSSAFSVSNTGVLAFWNGIPPQEKQLTWIRRDGVTAATVGPPIPMWGLRLSPDEQKIAIERYEPAEKTWSQAIWLISALNGAENKLTHEWGASAPVWSPDGSTIAFMSGLHGPPTVFTKPSNGTGAEKLLLQGTASTEVDDWSAKAGALVYATFARASQWDLWLLKEGQQPAPFLRTPFSEISGRVSPDGRWIAYISDETGKPEVRVTSFPTPGNTWTLSPPGSQPRWRRDGKELYYLSATDQLMAVPFTDSTTPVGVPTPLFKIDSSVDEGFLGISTYDAAADGSRFLVAVPMGERIAPPITVVLNWTATLQK